MITIGQPSFLKHSFPLPVVMLLHILVIPLLLWPFSPLYFHFQVELDDKGEEKGYGKTRRSENRMTSFMLTGMELAAEQPHALPNGSNVLN